MTDANSIGLLVIAATQLLTLFSLWSKLTGKPDKQEIHPQPLHVRNSPEALTRDEHTSICAAHKEDIIRLRARDEEIVAMIHSACEKLDKTDEERARRLHSRVDGIVNPLNILIGKVENHIQESHK